MGFLKLMLLALSVVAGVSALPTSADAIEILESRQLSSLYPFVPAAPEDRRSPCPMLNALANHGFLPHNGQNISMDDLVKAFSDSVNLEPSVTKFVSKKGFTKTSTGRPDTLNLDDLDQHDIIEHDASLSREDCAVGDCVHFDPKIWANTASYLTDPIITIQQAANARNAAVARAKAANPWYELPAINKVGALLETTIYLAVFGDVSHGNANRDWVNILFNEERIPFDEGFKRSDSPLKLAPLLLLASKVEIAMIIHHS